MKKLFTLAFVSLMIAGGFSSCKKCQTCTTKTTQNVLGFDQTVTTSEEYCGDDYDNAPTPGSYSQNVGGITQQVEITCN